MPGDGVLKVTFHEAQAHTATGGTSIVSQPPPGLGMTRMVSWAPVGDFEGALTCGIGIAWPIPQSNPQFAVRVTEVEKVTSQGQHRYVVAFDVDATPLSGRRRHPEHLATTRQARRIIGCGLRRHNSDLREAGGLVRLSVEPGHLGVSGQAGLTRASRREEQR